ncbi:MAG TPA: hypothetical protein VGL51_06160 [Solirubrobacteraceae bacterium]|jgi:hypothetical protein
MPSGRGFAITARRYVWRAHSYVALTASVVGHTSGSAGTEREVASGNYGSTQSNLGRPSASFVPFGLVDCSAHPAVLLFGWTAAGVRASLRQAGVTRALRRTTPPAALGLGPGVLVYGPLTSTAAIIQPEAPAHPLGAPPAHRACRDGTETISYGFPDTRAGAGAARPSSMSGSG